MIIDKFVLFTTDMLTYLGQFLPADIVLWIGSLLTVLLLLAAWRIVS